MKIVRIQNTQPPVGANEQVQSKRDEDDASHIFAIWWRQRKHRRKKIQMNPRKHFSGYSQTQR